MSLLACFGKGKGNGKRKAAYLEKPTSSAPREREVERVFTTGTGVRLVIKSGDITHEDVDAIVNAANERMLGGGGVDGAIHKTAGPQLLEACRAVPEVEPDVRCPTGEARITPGFKLKARHVIHTVGPVYRSDGVSAPLLAAAVSNSLRLAAEKGVTSISFPAIGTGVYGYPGDKAARVSITAVTETLAALDAKGQQLRDAQQAAVAAGAGVDATPEQPGSTPQQWQGCSLKEVRFVLFGDALYQAFARAAEETVTTSATPPATQ